MKFKNKIINTLGVSVLFSIVLAITQLFTVSTFASSFGYTWSNVSIGGGGYTTGIVIHPKEPGLMYARSDVGGIFRWDMEEKKWTPLLDSIGYSNSRAYGVDGIAVDPNNADVLYAAVGKNWNQTGDVIKSTDKGETWTFTNLNKQFHGNGQWRYTGELIAVDPANSDIIYVGTRSDGLYKSVDGAQNWQKVSGVPAGEVVPQSEMPLMPECEYPIGTRSVVFDPTSASKGASQIIYASVIGKGVYQTKNAGTTWTLMSGSPTLAARMEAASDGVLYVTTLGQGVKKYSGGSWIDITPSNSDLLYCGLSVDPNNSDNVIVSRWANSGNCTELPIYRSKDKGASWEFVSTTGKNRKFAPTWFPSWFFLASTSQVIFDRHNSGQVFAADWYSVWKTPNIWTDADSTRWYATADGLENTCVFTLVSMPAGANLFSGGADFGGHRHVDLNSFPDGELIKTMGNINSVDFCEADPSYVAVTGSRFHDDGGVFQISSDNGKTFTQIMTPSGARNGRVAYSATDPKRIVWVPQSGEPIVTTDMGETWQATTGAPTDTVTDFWLTKEPLASDRVNGNTFYLLRAVDGETNEFYRSTDGGVTWKMVNNTQLSTAVPWFWPQVKAAPGMESEVWVAQSTNGLFRSSDGGDTFTKVENVQNARLVAFGKNPPGKDHPAVFVQGKVNGIDDGVFRSDDMGKTWIRINDETSKIGNVPNSMAGDRQVFGRVYIGTNGSGIYCGESVQNAVCYEDFLTEDILPYTANGAEVNNGVLHMPEGASVAGIKMPKNSSVEFDIKAASSDGIGKLNFDMRKNSDGLYRVAYSSDGFRVARHSGGEETILASVINYDKYALSTIKNVHVKYVVFEDRIGIYFNGKLIKTVIDSWFNKGGISYELSFANEEQNDSENHEVYIDNLKIKKVVSSECEDLYEKVFYFDDFNGTEIPWYANASCQIVDGSLKIIEGGKFSAYTIPQNAFIECDLSYQAEAEITEADSENVFTMEWNLRKTYDSQYYHLVNVRYNYYYKTINIQVTKVDNGQKIWVGETTVPSNSECRLRLCCAGENMSVQIDGKTIYTWEDDISYPQDAKYTVTERAWSTVRASAYVLMDNYKIAEDTGIRNLDVFIDEITFNKNDGGVISGSEKLVDGIYALRVNLNNLNEEAKNVDIIIGIYQNNMLIDVKIVPVVIEADVYSQTVEVLFDLDCTKIDTKEPIELKGFMFDSMKNLRPLITNTSAEGMTIVDSSLDVIQFYSFNDDILPNCFSDKMFITENGMLRANGAGSRFVFSDMPKNCSFEFKIKPLKDMYIPKFQVIIGNSAFTFCDNNRQKNSWDDKFSVYNNITWGSALKEMWANGTFFPDAKNGHTIKYVSNNDTYTLYIDDIKIGEVSCTGVADNYKVSFTVADDAAIGMYIDDITVKYLE